MPHFLSSSAVPVGIDSTMPRLPTAHLPRIRLCGELLARPCRLRLLCAPAGFGKSVLLNECLRQGGSASRCIWLDLGGRTLSLDELCARLAESLDCDADPQALLRSLDQPLSLVLDDFPAEADDELNDWIDRLLALASSRLEVWVSSRQRPQWKLSRLVLADELLEVDARRLAFTREESDALLAQLTPHSVSEFAEMLWRQTLGWCAGVRLLLGSAAGGQPGLHRLREYLGDELLARLDEDERQLLISVAQLPRVSADFCDQLWELREGGALFRRLLRVQTLFQALDDEGVWYRLLPAVAKALQGELGMAERNRLRLHACRYLNGAGFVEEAIELALSTGQAEVAVSYMDRLPPDWLFTGQHLRAWLDWRARLPAELVECTPILIYLNTRALLIGWRLDEAAACLERLNRSLPQPCERWQNRVLSNWQALYGALSGMLGSAEAAREHCSSAPAHLGLRDWQSAYLCHSTLARVEMTDGQPAQAHRRLQDALELARRQGCLASEVMINAHRIRRLLLNGELAQAEPLVEECFRLLGGEESPHHLLLGRLLMLRGELFLLRGDLNAAEAEFASGVGLAGKCADPLVLHGHVGLSEVAACRGDFGRARQHMQEAERSMQCGNVHPGSYQATLTLQEMRIRARQGCWQEVLPLAEELLSAQHLRCLPPLHMPSLRQRNALLLALAEYVGGRVGEAERRLRSVAVECERLQFGGLLGEVRLALMRVERALGRTPIVGAGSVPEVSPYSLVAGWAEAATIPAGDAARAHSAEDLTAREFDVLELLAEGLSNQEIGERLFISLNTVKAHTIRINHKLGVKRRTQAVMRARSIGMLA